MLDWALHYKKEYLKGDISAGLTVGIMLIPQGMAYAMLAGLPPIYGLYSALIPIFVYALLGTSRQLAVGPVAMDSLLVASFVGTLAKADSAEYISLAILLAFMMGAIQILLGVIRLGFLVNFLSKPVVSGFTSAAAIIIGLSQLKHLLGADISNSNQIQFLVVDVFKKLHTIHLNTVMLGLGAIAIILLIKQFKIKIPAPLVVVVLGTLAVYFIGLDKNNVDIVKNVPQGLPHFSLPSFDIELWKTMLPMAGTLALLAFMEAISVAKAIQAKHGDYEIVPNRELIALGSANLLGSLFQSFPVTGGFSRTAVNDQAGAKTLFASVISGIMILLTLLFLTPLFYYLPKTVLAAIIMVAVFRLVDYKYPIKLWHCRRIEFYMLIITFVITLTVGILFGIVVGVVLSILVMIYVTTKPHVAILGRIPNTSHFRNVKRFDGLEDREDLLIMRFDAPMYYANAQFLKDTILSNAKLKPHLKCVVLSMESASVVDSTAIFALKEISDELAKKGTKLYFSGTIGPVRDVLYKSGFMKEVGTDKFHIDISSAIATFENRPDENENNIAVQTNFDQK